METNNNNNNNNLELSFMKDENDKSLKHTTENTNCSINTNFACLLPAISSIFFGTQ